jgi:hypothetical protein
MTRPFGRGSVSIREEHGKQRSRNNPKRHNRTSSKPVVSDRSSIVHGQRPERIDRGQKNTEPVGPGKSRDRKFKTRSALAKAAMDALSTCALAQHEWLAAKSRLDRHRSHFFFHLSRLHHRDGVPGAAVEEAAVGTFAKALLAADAENGIDRDTAERRAVLVGHPEHAVFHRTIFHARRRAGAAGATFCDHSEFFRFLLARRGQALGFRLPLHLVGNHTDSSRGSGCSRHGVDYNPDSAIFSILLMPIVQYTRLEVRRDSTPTSGTKPANGNRQLCYLAVFLAWLNRRLLSMVRPHKVAAHNCRRRVHRGGLLPASFPLDRHLRLSSGQCPFFSKEPPTASKEQPKPHGTVRLRSLATFPLRQFCYSEPLQRSTPWQEKVSIEFS